MTRRTLYDSSDVDEALAWIRERLDRIGRLYPEVEDMAYPMQRGRGDNGSRSAEGLTVPEAAVDSRSGQRARNATAWTLSSLAAVQIAVGRIEGTLEDIRGIRGGEWQYIQREVARRPRYQRLPGRPRKADA